MDNHEQILTKVGIALLVVGVIDIGFMAYCIINKFSYSSSFNIFAVIAGVYLIKGSIKTAKTVAFFSAFMLAGFSGLLLVFPFLEPVDLRLISFKLDPITSILSHLFMFLGIGFIYWVYKSLTSPTIMIARKNSGLSDNKPILGFWLGGIFVVGLAAVLYFTNNSTSASIAKTLAAEQTGDGYSYHISAMNFSGTHVSATLTAYRENEIKQVKVEWYN